MSQTRIMSFHRLLMRLLSAFYGNVKHFVFDLTCDVIGVPEAIKICFPSTSFPGLANGLLISRIGTVVSELGGGL